jgi:thiol-disulfide isomerase/thioredoxin
MPRRAAGLRSTLAILLLTSSAGGGSALAGDQQRVYSIRDAECVDCDALILGALSKLDGVSRIEFDKATVELSLRLAQGVSDAEVVAALERAGLKAAPGGGSGSYKRAEQAYPPDADVQTLTERGAAVGPLQKLRVPGKYTAFDVYADWCAPCRLVDRRLREIVTERKDVALRRLNVVDFDSPLARELGSRFDTLPYVVVFSPSGKRTDVRGADLRKLDAALAPRD